MPNEQCPKDEGGDGKNWGFEERARRDWRQGEKATRGRRKRKEGEGTGSTWKSLVIGLGAEGVEEEEQFLRDVDPVLEGGVLEHRGVELKVLEDALFGG
jgi:hypothetical protein